MPSLADVSSLKPPARKGQQTSQRILDVAEALFAERGYSGTTLRHVADGVGVRIPSLYNHFSSKASLYAAVLERGIGPVLAVLSGYIDPEADDYQDSRQVVERIMRLLSRRPSLPRLVMHETLAGGERLTPMLRHWIAPTFARAREMVEASPGARFWHPDQLELLVLAMYHIVVGYFAIAPLYKQLSGQDLTTKEALARQTRFVGDVVEALLRGEVEGDSPRIESPRPKDEA